MRAFPAVLFFLLAACAPAPVRSTDPPDPPPARSAETVDRSCKTDAECEVKNVGNCCGYYPACVNRASATFPDRVKAECAKKGTMGVCGFPDIKGCSCVEGRCADATGGSVVR
jgi:hypothetical protein